MNKFTSVFVFVATFTLATTAASYFVKPFATNNSSNVEIKEIESSSAAALPKAAVKENVKRVNKIAPSASRTVYITGTIGEQSAEIARQIISLNNSNEPIYLLINSPGGSVLDGAMILSAIEASKAPVYTVCLQLCASMAAIIFEYGTERWAVDRSLIMFHPAYGAAQDELDKMVSRLLTVQRYIGKMEAYIAKRVGMSYEAFKAKSAVELWLDGEDAVNSSFADKLVSVKIDESVIGNMFNDNMPNSQRFFVTPRERKFDVQW